jgi:DNA-binding CsgD family transcriptional regulator
VALARRGGRALDAAGTCEDAAGVLAALGRMGDARGLLDEALDRYGALDAAWLGARAGAALRDAGGGRGRRGPRRRPEAGWQSLTPSERAVAELVAEGLTNREVGRRLFVSPHTVNSHLRSAFRKLGVSSRAALAAAAAREDRAIG